MPWHWLLTQPPHLMGEGFVKEWQEEYPEAWAWNERLQERKAVTKAREDRSAAMKAGH